MPRNIVLCFDGTDNSVDGDCTNVLRLFRALERSDRQLTYYAPGVGTLADPSAKTWTGRKIARLVDSAIGHTLRENFCEAYRFLARTYRPTDEIFLFGFSRGAYTARVLAAALHLFGLLRPEHENITPHLWSAMLNDSGATGNGLIDTLGRFRRIFSTGDSAVPVHFLGVWDTVSSLGWLWDFRLIPFTANNPSVRIVRHAVAIDERRAFFRTNLFSFGGKDSTGRNTVADAPPDQDLKQVWFAGVHSDVGGGYSDETGGLSKIALEWMIREATQVQDYPAAGGMPARSVLLHVDPAQAYYWLGGTGELSRPDPLAAAHRSLVFKWWLGELMFRRAWNSRKRRKAWRRPNFAKRRSIAPGSTIHRSVAERIAGMASYRPRNLPPLDKLEIEE
ncbi:MAG: hypothetical protein AMXMBFR58_35100 [Phycisphaerae bacterium]|nr:hypothetical protein [Phycisphaerales bacterium]